MFDSSLSSISVHHVSQDPNKKKSATVVASATRLWQPRSWHHGWAVVIYLFDQGSVRAMKLWYRQDAMEPLATSRFTLHVSVGSFLCMQSRNLHPCPPTFWKKAQKKVSGDTRSFNRQRGTGPHVLNPIQIFRRAISNSLVGLSLLYFTVFKMPVKTVAQYTVTYTSLKVVLSHTQPGASKFPFVISRWNHQGVWFQSEYHIRASRVPRP